MSNQIEFWPLVSKYWLYQSPFSFLYIAGAVLVLWRRSYACRFGRLMLVGCVVSLVLNLGLPLLQVQYIQVLSAHGESLYTSRALDAFSVASNSLSALGLALFLWAAFVERPVIGHVDRAPGLAREGN